MRVIVVVSIVWLGTAAVAANPARDLGDLVPPGAELVEVWRGGAFTEGPVCIRDGSILFSDIGNRILRFDPATMTTAEFRVPSGRSNGLAVDAGGRLVACEGANTGGGRRISITAAAVGPHDAATRTLSQAHDGRRFNSPNDLAIDGAGNVWFSDPRYVGDEPRELDLETIFCVTPDGTTTIATREVTKPNGLAFTPDFSRLVVSDNDREGARQLLVFDVGADGTLTGKRVIHDFGAGRGVDGLKVDASGNIFATAGTGDLAGVWVLNATGKLLGRIPTPGDPTNCCFGRGADAHVLYVTTALMRDPPADAGGYGLMRITLTTRGP
jgi:sugar lactone lactonase YvrE